MSSPKTEDPARRDLQWRCVVRPLPIGSEPDAACSSAALSVQVVIGRSVYFGFLQRNLQISPSCTSGPTGGQRSRMGARLFSGLTFLTHLRLSALHLPLDLRQVRATKECLNIYQYKQRVNASPGQDFPRITPSHESPSQAACRQDKNPAGGPRRYHATPVQGRNGLVPPTSQGAMEKSGCWTDEASGDRSSPPQISRCRTCAVPPCTVAASGLGCHSTADLWP